MTKMGVNEKERDEEWKRNCKSKNLLDFPTYLNSYIPHSKSFQEQ